MISQLNGDRAFWGVAPVSWSSDAANYAQSFLSTCSWGNAAATTSYAVYSYASAPQSSSAALNVFQSLMSNGKSGYSCSTDTCSNNDCTYAYRAWIAATTTGFACVANNCPASTSPFSPQIDWSYTICVATPYAVYSGQHPLSTCPAGTRSTDCSSYCAGRNCGTVMTPCGEINCGVGACDAGSDCVDGLCQCTPSTTCQWRNVSCGNIVGNCGQDIRCNNNCQADNVCVPKTAADVCGAQVCGTAPDGCGGNVPCGSCVESEVCNAGACQPCSKTCHPLAVCTVDNECVCKAGYVGDGLVCNPAPPPSTLSCGSASWSAFIGSADNFLFSAGASNAQDMKVCILAHEPLSTATTSADVLLLSSYTYDTAGGDAAWAVMIQRNGSSVGIVGGADPASGIYQRFYWDEPSATFRFEGVSSSAAQQFSYSWSSPSWAVGTSKTLGLLARADGTMIALLDGVQLQGVRVVGAPTASFFGVYAATDAQATFPDYALATAASVDLVLSGCWTASSLTQLVATVVHIDPSQFTVSVTCNADGTTTATVQFSDGQSVLTRGIATPTNPATGVSRLSTVLHSGAVAQGAATGVPPTYPVTAPVDTVGGSSGLTGGEIAGIVIGSVAGGVLIIGGTLVLIAVLRRDDDDDDEPPGAPDPQKRRSVIASIRRSMRPKRRGVNVMENDPSKHHSLTARNPNIASY
jgi:hypothetical protein